MIELLVVISIIALLLAILLPMLQGVRKRAKATVCLSNLHQWGLYATVYMTENNGGLPARGSFWHLPLMREDYVTPYWARPGMRLCPMATRPSPIEGRGGSFFAYGESSYGVNPWIAVHLEWGGTVGPRDLPDAKHASEIPLILDSCACVWEPSQVWRNPPPPDCDAVPVRYDPYEGLNSFCMNRHDGGINSVFLDGSARKVGLKELWTLRWWNGFNRAGPWTKAGGVQPEDWPVWMRRFKDY